MTTLSILRAIVCQRPDGLTSIPTCKAGMTFRLKLSRSSRSIFHLMSYWTPSSIGRTSQMTVREAAESRFWTNTSTKIINTLRPSAGCPFGSEYLPHNQRARARRFTCTDRELTENRELTEIRQRQEKEKS